MAQHALSTLEEGAPQVSLAQGRGAATEADPLTLAEPGTVVLTVDDGLPFTAFLTRTDGAPSVEP